ncbi:Fibrinogen C domain-containing protein 1 [Bagarius yarrelli]|uniref:Fibrinogen C domain-containing protein 1 n=1 Tax=Bagarius yarrelli TaxID=175774 RepID=A0A556UFL9_BAGYA|nr:Fibrinogen C domain-containing protein 1 [Bagarius yarrelli]
MNHSQAPSGPDSPPLISTNQDEGNALVTVERGDGSRINIFIDPNCPDYNNNFLRLEGLQTSLLHSLSHHDTDLKSVKGQERALLVQLAEEIAKLSAHGSQLKAEYSALRQGQSSISQEISMLQNEQARLVQVFQRREDGSVNFYRDWAAYQQGFGKITGEHWLGLDRIHALTIQANYELRIDLEDFENSTSFAQYGSFGVGLFSVDPDEDGYPLSIADYSGTAGDSLLKHNGMKFTTKDKDNDHSENNCASFYHGAWWYRNCHMSNLNGQYLRGQHSSYADGIEWYSWTGLQYSLKFTEMKIKPTCEQNE